MIAHVVLFTPRVDLDRAGQEALVASLERACSDIPLIRRVRVGRRRILGCAYDTLSPVHFEYAAILEFDSEADLRAYLQHPAHTELGQRFTSSAAVAVAHDFEMVDAGGVRQLVSP
ncbi:MAG: Dabb family protein [Vicinamibacterales bacterium]